MNNTYLFLTAVFLVLSYSLIGQTTSIQDSFIVVVDYSNVTIVNDSTYIVDVSGESDQFGSSYRVDGINVGYTAIDSRGESYTVDSVGTMSFFTGTIKLIEKSGSNGSPSGRGWVHKNLSSGLTPVPASNSSGVAPIAIAKIITNNAIKAVTEAASGTVLEYENIQFQDQDSTISIDADLDFLNIIVGLSTPIDDVDITLPVPQSAEGTVIYLFIADASVTYDAVLGAGGGSIYTPDGTLSSSYTFAQNGMYIIVPEKIGGSSNWAYYISAPSGTGGGGSITFDGNRSILRIPSVSDNIGSTTLSEWNEWWYFAPPTATTSLSPTTLLYEYGDSTQITYSRLTSNPGGATLSNGKLYRVGQLPAGNITINNGSATSGSSNFPYEPVFQSTSQSELAYYDFYSSQEWNFGAESGTVYSDTTRLQAALPIFYGVDSTDFDTTGNIYSELTKLLEVEGDKSVTFTGNGYIYFAVPTNDWDDVTIDQILDHNGLNVTSSFTVYDITVSSSGLTNDWVDLDYKLFKLNHLTSTSGYQYQFKF